MILFLMRIFCWQCNGVWGDSGFPKENSIVYFRFWLSMKSFTDFHFFQIYSHCAQHPQSKLFAPKKNQYNLSKILDRFWVWYFWQLLCIHSHPFSDFYASKYVRNNFFFFKYFGDNVISDHFQVVWAEPVLYHRVVNIWN